MHFPEPKYGWKILDGTGIPLTKGPTYETPKCWNNQGIVLKEALNASDLTKPITIDLRSFPMQIPDNVVELIPLLIIYVLIFGCAIGYIAGCFISISLCFSKIS